MKVKKAFDFGAVFVSETQKFPMGTGGFVLTQDKRVYAFVGNTLFYGEMTKEGKYEFFSLKILKRQDSEDPIILETVYLYTDDFFEELSEYNDLYLTETFLEDGLSPNASEYIFDNFEDMDDDEDYDDYESNHDHKKLDNNKFLFGAKSYQDNAPPQVFDLSQELIYEEALDLKISLFQEIKDKEKLEQTLQIIHSLRNFYQLEDQAVEEEFHVVQVAYGDILESYGNGDLKVDIKYAQEGIFVRTNTAFEGLFNENDLLLGMYHKNSEKRYEFQFKEFNKKAIAVDMPESGNPYMLEGVDRTGKKFLRISFLGPLLDSFEQRNVRKKLEKLYNHYKLQTK